ncbi:MAG TPA: hypothetical protein VKA50_03550 [Gammaproteobacteria bacterium]|nr:hypothetical protein [Gammaproteobacteria bacterium]
MPAMQVSIEDSRIGGRLGRRMAGGDEQRDQDGRGDRRLPCHKSFLDDFCWYFLFSRIPSDSVSSFTQRLYQVRAQLHRRLAR